ncbi:hypothetical protein GCM10010424_06240 [Streptomyces lienomycini]
MVTLAPGVRLRGGVLEFGAKGVRLTRDNILESVTVRCPERPVLGSGVFVGGHGDWDGVADGGTVRVNTLCTGEIHTDGGIPAGTTDLISGGVFVISGAVVGQVLNCGPVTTYGQNDMVLDNWGQVQTWTATAPVTSHGPSGIGFVNFGVLGSLDVQAPITTLSLVRGMQAELAAVALSVKQGGRIGTATVDGRIATSGDHLTTVEIDGEVGTLRVTGGIHATGREADAVRVGTSDVDLSDIDITATDGQSIIHHAAS